MKACEYCRRPTDGADVTAPGGETLHADECCPACLTMLLVEIHRVMAEPTANVLRPGTA